MWRLSSVTLRERRTSTKSLSSIIQTSKRFQHALSCQLDYYMSPQFAGVASALVNNTYAQKGIDISFLPTCPVGMEQANVRNHQDANPSGTTVGSVEQNIFIPTLAKDPSLRVTAVAAMFGQSPLCIASLQDVEEGEGEKIKIGTHEDTVELMKRIFPSHDVVASPRATKNTDLMNGDYGAIQAYTTTEVPALRRHLGRDPIVTPLEGLYGTKLGYGQVIFTADECLEEDKKQIVQAFCEATFDGWAAAIRNPEEAAEMVREAKKMLKLDDEENDHWFPSAEFEVEMLTKCNEYVEGTLDDRGRGRYGVINAERWSDANKWLLQGQKTEPNFGLDPTVW